MRSRDAGTEDSLEALGLELGRSRLGLLDGLGALRLEQDGSGGISGAGVWCPVDGEFDHQELLELFRPGASLTYRGPVWRGPRDEEDGPTGAGADAEDVELEVEISGVERMVRSGARQEPASLVGLKIGAFEPDA